MAAAYSFGGLDWHKLFRRYGHAGTGGKISWPEFRALIRTEAKLGRAAVSDEDLNELYRSFAKNESGALRCPEFLDWVQPKGNCRCSDLDNFPADNVFPGSDEACEIVNVRIPTRTKALELGFSDRTSSWKGIHR